MSTQLISSKTNDYSCWILNLAYLSSHVLVPGALEYHHLHPCSHSILHQWISSVPHGFSGVVGGLEEDDHRSNKSILDSLQNISGSYQPHNNYSYLIKPITSGLFKLLTVSGALVFYSVLQKNLCERNTVASYHILPSLWQPCLPFIVFFSFPILESPQ